MINKVSKFVNNNIRNILLSQEKTILDAIYEVRIRVNYPVYIKTKKGDFFLDIKEKSKIIVDGFYKLKKIDISSTVALLTSNSLHAFEKEIEKGYITIEGGHRVGLSGDCIYEKNEFRGFKSITSVNIRIAKDYVNCSNKIFKYIIKDSNSIYNTLIAGPPLCGKTTCIRDLARTISNGSSNPYFGGCDVTVIDERGEIAAVYNGIPQVDIGCRTDVLSYCMKKEGFIMSIRALSPRVIISDELGSTEDYKIIQYALKSGVNIITTAHCNDLSDLYKNLYIKKIIEVGFIERIIILDNKNPVTIKQVYDNITNKVISYGNY
ncbi:stage III sporulation protein AA [Sedimentibacter sp. zth1]|uniref:stage III sporulation protein AA n=1 Tax=Sedimentibacter sp. zth1 TaxID=2816908 RepID=UPI001A935FD3|nr:stage III sporulation protein AA [Sedimentibacter sp. zth1]QSX06826.1 stage III sporulation protein AA [Sedimentibacter sp. zth1]